MRKSSLSLALLAMVLPCASCKKATPPAGWPPEAPTTSSAASGPTMEFPAGTATPAETCGACHKTIYKEFAFGFGSDLQYRKTPRTTTAPKGSDLPSGISNQASAHAFAGVDPWPIHARDIEEEGKSCNVCHFPQPFAIPAVSTTQMAKPQPRAKGQEAVGLTCASCHLTPDNKIRGPYAVAAPHRTVQDPAMQGSAMCAYCHSAGKRVSGKQTQTFFEWREDFHKPGLGKQECQDCHMPRIVRKLADDIPDVPARAVGRHLWTGGHSMQRLRSALTLSASQGEEGKAAVEFRVNNVGAGHSVPTGSNRRGVYLIVEALDAGGKQVAGRQWLFAPWYGDRPDDKSFLEQDKTRKDAISVSQADAQGPHEPPIRAGDVRVLTWDAPLKEGQYTINARLIYDLNRYNDRSLTEDQTEVGRVSVAIRVK